MMTTTGTCHSQTSGFSLVDFDKLIALANSPVDLTKYDSDRRTAKSHCPWFMPSDIGNSKKKADCEAHNRYTALVVDIDDGNWQLPDITENLNL